MVHKFLTIVNKSESEAEIKLYGAVQEARRWFWDDESSDLIVQSEVLDELEKLKDKKKITVRINSSGGDVFVAQALYTNLKNHKAKITVIIDGIAASAATIIAMAGDKIIIPTNAMMMIHDPMVGIMGYFNAEELEKKAIALEKVKKSIMNAYLSKVSIDEEELYKMMREESWLTADDCVEKGFADEVMFEKVKIDDAIQNNFLITNGISHDLSSFKNKPCITVVNQPLYINNQNKNKKGEVKMDLETLKKEHPELLNAYKNEIEKDIRNDAVKEERERMKKLDELKNSVSPELLNKAKYEEFDNAESLAYKAMLEQQNKSSEYLKNSKDDSDDSKDGDVTPPANEPATGEEKPATLVDRLKNSAMNLDKRRRGIE